MAVRNEKVEATRQRILEATRELFDEQATEFTLEQIAATASVSVQTVIRAFGSKQALIIEAIGTFRPTEESVRVVPSGTAAEIVKRLFDDYEEMGDRVIFMLAEEQRIPAFAEVAAMGRTTHRTWVEAAFAPQLKMHPPRRREPIVIALVTATDVYVWKLLRRDLHLTRNDSESTMSRLIRGVLPNMKGT
jgi:AcrR family transcriptional regulator